MLVSVGSDRTIARKRGREVEHEECLDAKSFLPLVGLGEEVNQTQPDGDALAKQTFRHTAASVSWGSKLPRASAALRYHKTGHSCFPRRF